jgi:predicted ester cyclase
VHGIAKFLRGALFDAQGGLGIAEQRFLSESNLELARALKRNRSPQRSTKNEKRCISYALLRNLQSAQTRTTHADVSAKLPGGYHIDPGAGTREFGAMGGVWGDNRLTVNPGLRSHTIEDVMMRMFACLLLALAAVQAAAGQAMTAATQAERNEAVAQRVFDEIFNQGRFEAANEIYAPDFVNHGTHRNAGLAEDQAAVRWEKKVVPNLHIAVDLITANQDTVTVVWTARGRNTGHAGWIPATGAPIEVRGITVWRVVDGRIHDEWTSFDELSILRQVAGHLWWLEIGLVAALLLLDWGLNRLVGNMWEMAKAR